MKFSRKFRFGFYRIEINSKKVLKEIEESLANAAKKSKSKNCLKSILFVQNFYHFKIEKKISNSLQNVMKKTQKKKKLQNKNF